MSQQQYQAEVMDELRQLEAEWLRDAEAQAEYLEYIADSEREEKLIRSAE